MRTSQSPYLSRLDHLRFFAASLVVVFHYLHTQLPDLRSGNPLVSLVDEGHTGVALFMVISGFIFTVIAGGHDLRYAGFLRNRIVRIYPLFVFAVFVQLFIGTYNDQRNYGFLQLLGWLVPFRSDTVPLSPQFVQLWTIWVEFQFYLIFPFLLAFSRRSGARYLWGMILLLAMTRALVFLATGSVRFIAYETILGRLDQLLLGMLLGRAWLARDAMPGPARRGAGPAGRVAMLLAAVVAAVLGLHLFSLRVGFTNLDSAFWIVWPTCEGALWSGVVWTYLRAGRTEPAAARGVLDRALAALGATSFSIYVMHNLVISAYRARLPVLPIVDYLPGNWNPGANVIATGAFVVLPLVLCVAAVTYRMIEKPFLALRVPYTRPSADEARAPAAAVPVSDAQHPRG